ncbi:MAG TPA: hypothetical protein VG838_13760 [Opitutaceae bacterium]|nr:hypothetical protein [Opitutaceae bacterium]
MFLTLAQVSVVHVDNPTFGMEFLVFAAGFICGAIAWRMILGRW